jgi:hypothetical protein
MKRSQKPFEYLSKSQKNRILRKNITNVLSQELSDLHSHTSLHQQLDTDCIVESIVRNETKETEHFTDNSDVEFSETFYEALSNPTDNAYDDVIDDENDYYTFENFVDFDDADDDIFLNCFEDEEFEKNELACEMIAEEEEFNLCLELQQWFLEEKVYRDAFSRLLKILKRHPCFHNIPSDARTITKTPRKIDGTKTISGGQYHHFGLQESIEFELKKLSPNQISDIIHKKQINLQFNLDGVPIKKSTGDQFWPLLCKFSNTSMSSPFIVGVYYGQTKPKDTDFLKDFVADANKLVECGVNIESITTRIVIDCIICDAPARAFIAQIKGHTGKFGCGKCIQEGVHDQRRMSFPETQSQLRNDEDFKHRRQEDHHVGTSVLEDIKGFGMVSQLPLDYMHLLCLGIMRKLFFLWMQCNLKFRLPGRKIDEISNRLLFLKSFIPREFPRKPRSLKEIARWKATEFRQVLLYTGPYIFQNILSKKIFMNFLVLHFAVRIFLQPRKLSLEMIAYLQSLMELFVKEFSKIYGSKYISYNVHNLLHICNDIKKFGNLNSFSAFPFESYLQTIKAFINTAQKPLEQLKRRIFERRNLTRINENKIDPLYPKLTETYNTGTKLDNTHSPYYKSIIYSDFMVNHEIGNNCVILDDKTIVVIENIATATFNGEPTPVIIGKSFRKIDNFYEYPNQSIEVGIYKTSNLSHLQSWPVSKIKTKAICVPISEGCQYYVAEIQHIV